MIVVKNKLANIEALLTLIVVSLLIISVHRIECQAIDGDENFQVFHEDIGRISGSQGVQVAPQVVVRQVEPVATVPVVEPKQVYERPPAGRARASHHHQPGRARISQAVRQATQATPVSVVPARAEPTFTQLVAPPQLQSTFQPAAEVSPANQLISAAPALTSFRNTASTSARHSALMAQVAVERQASSLGSPLVALSSPAVAQVQPPHFQSHSSLFQTPEAASSPQLVSVAEEQLVAPSFEHVLSRGCPLKGVFSYENKDYCDRYYICTNGTFTEEACPNGLVYSQLGAVYQHCAYNWNVDCGRKKAPEPLSSPGCPWQFGIFPVTAAGKCSIDYFVCEWGVPETRRCTPEGLFYDDRIKGCQWADQLGCKSENLLNFKCPAEDEDNPYWPYPRYYYTKQDIIVCVNEQPRLVHCNEDQLVDPSSLACIDLKKKNKKRLVS